MSEQQNQQSVPSESPGKQLARQLNTKRGESPFAVVGLPHLPSGQMGMLNDILNELFWEGWELVSIYPTMDHQTALIMKDRHAARRLITPVGPIA